MSHKFFGGLLFALALLLGTAAPAADKMKLLILDGQNNHAWAQTTPVLKQIYEETGLYDIAVATSPPKGQSMADFKPKFADYQVVVSNYNGDELCEDAKRDFLTYVRNGGGLVIVHAANNSFTKWPEYNDMIGLGWRDNKFGDRVAFDDSGKLVRMVKGEGPGAGHGPQHEFKVMLRDAEHPITKGLPKEWLHTQDELYGGQRGPAQNMQILASAYASPDKKGSGMHEPMLWIIPYGKGRVFTTVLGHSPAPSMKCVGFQVTLVRGTEWAATGKVTQTKIPDDFPTADKSSARK